MTLPSREEFERERKKGEKEGRRWERKTKREDGKYSAKDGRFIEFSRGINQEIMNEFGKGRKGMLTKIQEKKMKKGWKYC